MISVLGRLCEPGFACVPLPVPACSTAPTPTAPDRTLFHSLRSPGLSKQEQTPQNQQSLTTPLSSWGGQLSRWGGSCILHPQLRWTPGCCSRFCSHQGRQDPTRHVPPPPPAPKTGVTSKRWDLFFRHLLTFNLLSVGHTDAKTHYIKRGAKVGF